MFDEFTFRLIFVGHIHFPCLFAEKNNEACVARKIPIEHTRPIELARNDRYIVSVGAVGYSRDGIKKIRYGIYDDDAYTLEIRSIVII